MLTIGGEPLEPGQRVARMLPLGCRPDGTAFGVPIMGLVGARPGPILGITTGIHGDEYEGPEAVRQLLNEFDPAALSGAIICTPAANIGAYEVFARVGWIDYLDLNRSFPGRSDGFLTQRIADVLVQEIVEQANYLVDLHSAGLAYALEPYVGFNTSLGPTGEESFRLAKSFGLQLLYGSTPFPNVLRLEATKREIPAILVEVGGEGRLRPELVQRVKRGLVNVLRALGMLPGMLEGLPNHYTLIQAPLSGEFSHVPTGGFLHNKTRLGGLVRAGETLATIVDVFGKELAQIAAPIDGLVLSYRTLPVVRTGEWGYSVVHVVGTVEAETTLIEVVSGSARA